MFKKHSLWSSFVKAMMSPFTLVLATLVAFFMIMAASLVSISMAVSVAGVIAVSFFALTEKKQRLSWEKTINKKLKSFDQAKDKALRMTLLSQERLSQVEDKVRMIENRVINAKEERGGLLTKQETNKSINKVIEKIETLGNLATKTLPQTSNENDQEQEKPRPANLTPDMDYYNSLSDTVVTELIQNALEENSIYMFLQPIMRLPQRQIRFYEVYGRIRSKPGRYMPAQRYLSLARENKQMDRIDTLILIQCLKMLEEANIADSDESFFINITSGTIKDRAFMSRLLQLLSKKPHLARRLIFELSQEDMKALPAKTTAIIESLGKAGCTFSMDNVTTMDIDIKKLDKLNVRFIKFDALFLLERVRSNQRYATAIWKMKRAIEKAGIAFVVEKIESEFALRELLDFDLYYGQGNLFGKPELQGAYLSEYSAQSTFNNRKYI